MSPESTEPRGLVLQLVLIHHGDDARLTAARQTVQDVCQALQVYGNVTASEIWRQPPPLDVGTAELAARRLRQWRLERKWARYTSVSRRWVLSTGLVLVRLAQLLSREHRVRARRQAFVEHVLTSKHVQAWRAAYDADAEALVVLEDDARADTASMGRLRELVTTASALGQLTDAYLDLAGGLGLQHLRLDQLTHPVGEGGVLRLRTAATNTTCGYLIGRNVIEALLQQVVTRPETCRLPPDWLINASLMAATSSDPARVLCLHSLPPALTHGSLSGSVPSSIRGVR